MADVSGTWLGTYWQQDLATRFEASLVQSGNMLSGNILDDSDLGEALVSGEVVGRSVRFVKQYVTSSPAPIAYTGTLSESEDFMQGQWFLNGFSGKWEARRGGEDLMSSLRKAIAGKVPALAK